MHIGDLVWVYCSRGVYSLVNYSLLRTWWCSSENGSVAQASKTVACHSYGMEATIACKERA